MPDNEDLDLSEYRECLLDLISDDKKLNELMLNSFILDDYKSLKQRLEILEQRAINLVLERRLNDE